MALVLCLTAFLAGWRADHAVAPTQRELAMTFDDLPGRSGAPAGEMPELRRLTRGLLGSLKRHHIPAVGFVIEGLLAPEGSYDPERIELLRAWLDAGMELGNHTYSHLDLHAVATETFLADAERGDSVTRLLQAGRGRTGASWFRHPFLHTGRTLSGRDSVKTFLAARGYRIAPVTIDNADYIFANAYDRSRAAGDSVLTQRIRETYVGYLAACVTYYERQAVALFGREIRQVLLVHANGLNADVLDSLAARLEGRGYRFVTLSRALEDRAFQTTDRYTGPGGISWIHRWALSRGKRGRFFAGEPTVPDFVQRAAGAAP